MGKDEKASILIPLAFIDQEWLEDHPDSESVALINYDIDTYTWANVGLTGDHADMADDRASNPGDNYGENEWYDENAEEAGELTQPDAGTDDRAQPGDGADEDYDAEPGDGADEEYDAEMDPDEYEKYQSSPLGSHDYN